MVDANSKGLLKALKALLVLLLLNSSLNLRLNKLEIFKKILSRTSEIL
jgi:hypothetical protein